MSQDGDQPLVPITQDPLPTSLRKLKRFRSEPSSATSSSLLSASSAPPNSSPSTPPPSFTPSPSTPPLAFTPTPSTPPPVTPPLSFLPPSTPPFTPDADESTNLSTHGENENTKLGESDTMLFTRRILKIAKSTAKPESPNKPSATATSTFETIIQPGTLRPDGTRRKEIRIRAKQLPKISQSLEPKPAKKRLKMSRIRPNTNFLTRLLNSSERHNANLVNLENSGSDGEIPDSAENSSEEYFEDENENDEEGDGEDDAEGETSPEAEGFSDKISSIIESASQDAKRERLFIMKQVRKMRQKEGITLIHNLAKLYGLHVTIAEEEYSLDKASKNEERKRLKSNGKNPPLPPKPSPINRIVKSVGKIGYKNEESEMERISI